MGTRRKSAAALELSGAFKKNPERKPDPDSIPQPTGSIGEPPPELDAQQQAAWRELADNAPLGLLTASDRALLEMTCRLVAKTRGGTAKTGDFSLLRSCLSSLGLSPVDRQRATITPQPKKSRLREALEGD